jgi:hypothetical protein
MSTSPSRLSYADCFNIYDQALEADRGIRIKFLEHGDAMNFRVRLHTARAIDRKDNKEIYADGERLHGRSIYDVIRATVRNIEGGFYIYLEKMDGNNLEVESLDEPEAEPAIGEAPPAPAVDRRI